MSMLAEPRRRSKYSTDPRGLNWSQDENKFGQKMLERMGWNHGKGLGANEDGCPDHISVQHKADTRGVGCSKSHADNWIAHQDDFNSLLSSLNESNQTLAKDDGNASVLSLEERSKSSRGRVHYMKFTKGKDLSSKSREDLSCIFGRRKSKSAPSTPLTQSGEDSGSEDSDTERKESGSAENICQSSHGVVTIKNSLSVNDYFAQKMAEMKTRLGQDTEEYPDMVQPVVLHKSHTAPANLQNMAPGEMTSLAKSEPLSVTEVIESKRRKKSKKEKKRKRAEIDEIDEYDKERSEPRNMSFVLGDDSESEIPKKKKKKHKSKLQEKNEPDVKELEEARVFQLESKTEHKNETEDMQCNQLESQSTKKKKKKSRKSKRNKTEQGEGAKMEIEYVKITSKAWSNYGGMDSNMPIIEEKKKKKEKVKKQEVKGVEEGTVLKRAEEDPKRNNPEVVTENIKEAKQEVEKPLKVLFKGSNLGEIEGYGGGTDLSRKIPRQEKAKKK